MHQLWTLNEILEDNDQSLDFIDDEEEDDDGAGGVH